MNTILNFPTGLKEEPQPSFMNDKPDGWCEALLEDALGLHEKLSRAQLLGKTENGLAKSLPMLFAALGLSEQYRAICDALPHKQEAFSLVDVMNTLVHMGYVSHRATLMTATIDRRLLPCLFVRQEEAFVILEMDESQCMLWAYDTRMQTVLHLPYDYLDEGTVLFFRLRDPIKIQLLETARRATDIGWYRSMLQRFRPLAWQAIGISMMLNLVSLIIPVLIMLVYDRVVGAHAQEDMPYLTVGFVLAILVESGLRWLRARQVAWLSVRMDLLTASAIISRLIRLPPVLIERASVASQLSRIKGFEEIRDFFTGPLFLTIIELPFIVFLLAVIALLGGWLAAVPLAMAAVYALVVFAARPLTRQAMHKAARMHANRHEMMVETFDHMQGIRYVGMQKSWLNRFRIISGEASFASFRSSQIASVLETIAYTLTVMAGLITLYMGVTAVLAGSMTAGALVACMMLTWRVLAPLSMLCTSLPRIEQLYQTIAQVNRLMNLQIESERPGQLQRLNALHGHIQCTNVGLRYQAGADPVFAGLTFSARPGELIAITGSNGAGKSSILKLINGLYQAQAGSILIDGMDIRQFNSVELRRYIAYVPQNPDFFAGTIADNLRLADPLADDEQLWQALKSSGADEEVALLPERLETQLFGGRECGLPATLAYRINLARACLTDAKIMLCDEMPYALLSSKHGQAYRHLILKWRGKRTVLMVAHREDYIRLADRAIALRSGMAPSIGKPDDILRLMKGTEYDTLKSYLQ